MLEKQELEQFLQARGWYLAMVPKRRSGKLYAYAKQRRPGNRGVSRYLIAESRMEELTEQEVLKRIQS